MIGKLLSCVAAGVLMSVSASADSTTKSELGGEALAWTVAAYASCESPSLLQADFKAETTKMQASMVDVLAALEILSEADNVCGQMNTFAVNMLALAESDMATLEARLGAERPAATPVSFDVEEPEGAGAQNSIILSSSADLPPLSGSSNPPSSDYQE